MKKLSLEERKEVFNWWRENVFSENKLLNFWGLDLEAPDWHVGPLFMNMMFGIMRGSGAEAQFAIRMEKDYGVIEGFDDYVGVSFQSLRSTPEDVAALFAFACKEIVLRKMKAMGIDSIHETVFTLLDKANEKAQP